MKVLITGTSRGIGKAIALKFLSKGHTVYGFDILPSTINDSDYHHYIHNITDINYPELPEIDILINNAGVQTQTMNDILVNLMATISLTEHYALHKGIKSVLNVSSASAITGSEFPEYAASKGGLNTYTKNLALRIAKYDATCNSVCPGGVVTELNEHIINNPLLYDLVKEETLFNKWSDVSEIAEWCYFLTVVNKSMTGENLLIDNGEMLKSNFIW